MTTKFSIVYINNLWLVHTRCQIQRWWWEYKTWRSIKPFLMTTYVSTMSQNPLPLAFWPPQCSMTPMYSWWFTNWWMLQRWTLHGVPNFETIVTSNVAYPHQCPQFLASTFNITTTLTIGTMLHMAIAHCSKISNYSFHNYNGVSIYVIPTKVCLYKVHNFVIKHYVIVSPTSTMMLQLPPSLTLML
jgi:hypothetical protein